MSRDRSTNEGPVSRSPTTWGPRSRDHFQNSWPFALLSVEVFAACANSPAPVAQISNLLYRRASSLRVGADRARSTVLTVCRLEIGDTADWKSALLWLRLRRARSLRGSIAASRMSARTIARREKSPGPGFSRALSRAGRKIVVAKLKGFCFLYVNNAPFWCVG